MEQPTVFLSYSLVDEEWRKQLERQLRVLQVEGALDVWSDRDIEAGSEWLPEIEAAIERARVAVLLVSADFLTSEFVRRVEIPRFLERRGKGGLKVVPVLVRPCPWNRVDWLAKMQILPGDNVALSGLSKHGAELALSDIALEIDTLLRGHQEVAGRVVASGGREVSIGRLPVTGGQLFGRDEQLQQLDQAWTDPDRRVVSLVAWGGVGKSALVNRWLRGMEGEHYRGAERVLGWSFYSQGTRDQGDASADEFIDWALRFFGDPDPSAGGPWERGERLARLVRGHRSLLILDGLEPLQHQPGKWEGRPPPNPVNPMPKCCGAGILPAGWG